MLETLTNNPWTKVSDLPGAQEWAGRFFATPGFAILSPDQPFLQEISRIRESGTYEVTEATTWDPYGEGYDDGPGDLSDVWHTNDRSSTGQYSGVVVEGAFDELSAILGAALANESDIFDEFDDLAETNWVPPLSPEQRDEKVSNAILTEWLRLSSAAREALLKKLSAL